MAFREVQFHKGISFGAIGGPGFNTDVVTVRSGHEKRNANWSEMRHKWEVSQAVKTEAHFEAVRAFFMASKGMLIGFRFKDWADYRASITEGVAQGIDATTAQLQKKYASPDIDTRRHITKPIVSTIALKYNGIPKTRDTHYTLDATTGIITAIDVTMTDAAYITWSGEFDVPARFGVDELNATIRDRRPDGSLLLAWESIPILETRDIA